MTVKTHRKRSIASAITYRATSTVLLAAISWAVTGQWIESLAVTLTFALLATVLYYFNDRAWERTDWGRISERGLLASGPGSSQDHQPSTPQFPLELVPLHREYLEEAS